MASKAERFQRLKPYVDPNIRKILLELSDDELDEARVRQEYEEKVPLLITIFGSSAKAFLTPEEVNEFTEILIDQYLHEMAVNKPSGFAYKNKECTPWVQDIQDQEWFFWERYERYLLEEKGWERKVVKTMGEDTLNILDLMADPRPNSLPAGADRRGLVVADVQSGKTSNYIGLMARAADARYRVIIVLAGIYNVLRSQTQVRIEEGFVGFSSTDNTPVGVGLISTEKRWRFGSTKTQDFGKRWLQPLMGTVGKNDNWVFVIKKNKSVLESLIQWLATHPEIKGPLLLIDDEADNASINVKYAQDDISVINRLIRKLLKHFEKSSYVGYTATPFANILIDPRAETDEEGEDIFPRSFIYTLEPSTNYFGSDKVFSGVDDENKRPSHIRYIDDIDDILPSKHKRDVEVPCLPPSLAEAVRAFLVATTIRYLQDDGNNHTTMMVNVSPYTDVQRQITVLIRDYVTSIRQAVRAFSLLPDNLTNKTISLLHDTWVKEYAQEHFTWDEIRSVMYDAIKAVHVVTINCASKDVLDYDNLDGEHVIAVGGYRLSRGLTLEGLIVSYYSRNSRAYDTLMQMARWFGYRLGYEGLCRVWMSSEAAYWYSFVADATVELIGQLRNMRQLNSDPSTYGLMVRQCPSSLIITARNKMGVGKIESHPLNLNGSFIETTALLRGEAAVDANFVAARTLAKALVDCGASKLKDTGKSVGFTGVSPQLVKNFINSFQCAEFLTGQPQRSAVIASIDKLSDYLSDPSWDVVFVNGSDCAHTERIGCSSVSYEERFPGAGTDSYAARVGNKGRLSSRDVEAFGLPKKTRDAIDAKYFLQKGSKNTPGVEYRKKREKPLLVVHFIRLRFKATKDNEDPFGKLVSLGKISSWDGMKHHEENVGWSISYPIIKDRHLLEFDYLLNGPAIEALEAPVYDEDEQDV